MLESKTTLLLLFWPSNNAGARSRSCHVQICVGVVTYNTIGVFCLTTYCCKCIIRFYSSKGGILSKGSHTCGTNIGNNSEVSVIVVGCLHVAVQEGRISRLCVNSSHTLEDGLLPSKN